MNEDAPSPPFSNSEPNLSPQSVVDCASLTNCMVKNKESLKVKLMQRRPIDVLVDQGILPPPKSSPSFYEQKLKLERAKTGDFLKHKIQRRPLRDELIQQHILEDSFDPCYYEQQRKLKKARLADDLNERLSQRPGPLELIKGNILHTDETLEQAIKEGQITFKKTCEGEVIKHPPKRFIFEEESSSDSAPSPHQSIASNQCTLVNAPNATNYQLSNSFIVTNGSGLISIPQAEPSKVVPNSNVLTNLSYIVTTPVANILPPTSSSAVFLANDKEKTSCLNVTAPLPSSPVNVNLGSKCDPITVGPSNQVVLSSTSTTQIGHNHKVKKKVKSKNQPKTRIIKFHEYTGPPNAKKQSNSSQSHSETSYELLLKQQQMFLQWQLECRHKYPQMAANQRVNEESLPSKEGSLQPTSNEIAMNNLESDSTRIFDDEVLSPPSTSVTTTSALTMNSSNNFHTITQSSPLKVEDPVTFESSQTTKVNSADTPSVNASINANNQNSSKQFMPIVKKIISKLEDMKVSDLKAELKKRNLPVSGAKQQLIERLKPFSESVVSTNNSMVTAEFAGTATIFNLGECTNSSPEILDNNNSNNNTISNFTPIAAPTGSLPNSTTFILKNNISSDVKKGLKEELLFTIANNNDSFSTIQLKQSSPITLDAPTLTIPITNTFIPQYQIVSSTPTDNSKQINLGGINLAAQSPIASNLLLNNNKLNILNHQPSIISTNLNYSQAANPIGSKNSNLTILTGEPIHLGPIKSGLSFNITQPMPSISNKLVSIQNPGPFFHQLLLYPTALNTPQEVSTFCSSQTTLSKQRSNSLPSESFHQLQRNTSLPLVINQVPVSQTPPTHLPSKCATIANKKVLDLGSLSATQLKSPNCSALRTTVKKSCTVLDSQPNSSTENNISLARAKLTKIEPKSINCELTKGDKSQSKPLQETAPTISSTMAEYQTPNRLPEPKPVISENNTTQIQPDSTTNSNSIDLDFILNFDDLHDGLGEVALDEPMDFEQGQKNLIDQGKGSGIIDFNDNWFDIDFGQSPSHMQICDIDATNQPISNTLSSDFGNAVDSSFLDSINQIFDQNSPSCSSKSSEFNFGSNFKQDSALLQNSRSSCTTTVSSNGSQGSLGNFPNQPCHFSANYSGNTLKYNLNGSSNAFSVDSLSDFRFEDSDFKTSIDFPPIMLDS